MILHVWVDGKRLDVGDDPPLRLYDAYGNPWVFEGFMVDASHEDGRVSVEGFVRPRRDDEN